MKHIIPIILFLYYTSWFCNRSNYISVKFKVNRFIKVILNPWNESGEFDLISIFLEIYAHLSVIGLIIMMIYDSKLIEIFKNIWISITFGVLFIVSGIEFILYSKNYQHKITRMGMIIVGVFLIILGIGLISSLFINIILLKF